MLTPEEINYIREWAKSGNEPRHMGPTDGLPTGGALVDLDICRLTREALAIAKLADALEQACETAEELIFTLLCELASEELNGIDTELVQRMRTNRKELLG